MQTFFKVKIEYLETKTSTEQHNYKYSQNVNVFYCIIQKQNAI